MSIPILETSCWRKLRLPPAWRPIGPTPAAVPRGRRIYAIGDIHGCAALLDQMHRRLVEDASGYKGCVTIVYLGDYIDRGPESKGVIDRLVQLRGLRAHFLKGNHEAALLTFLRNPATYHNWRNYGAAQTLLSYGVRPPTLWDGNDFMRARDELMEKLPEGHLRFFEELELSASIGGYFFAHAGARPGIELDEQQEEDLIWIRDEFLASRHYFGKVVVHGHTREVAPSRQRHRIGIDTGAYATGVLSCVVLEGETQRFIQAASPRQPPTADGQKNASRGRKVAGGLRWLAPSAPNPVSLSL